MKCYEYGPWVAVVAQIY